MHLFRLICLLASSVVFSHANALEQLSFTVEQAKFSGWKVELIQTDLELSTSSAPQLNISIDKLTSPANGDFRNVHIHCSLPSMSKFIQFNIIECLAGNFFAKHDQLGKLQGHLSFVVDRTAETIDLSINKVKLAKGSINLQLKTNKERWKLNLKARSLDVVRLKKIAAIFTTLPNVTSDETGRVNFQLASNGYGDNLTSAKIKLNVFDLGFDGSSVAEELDASMNLTLQKEGNGWRIKQDLSLLSGAMYLEPGIKIGEVKPGFLLEVDKEPINLVSNFRWRKNRIQMHRMLFSHPDIMTVEAKGRVLFDADSAIDDLTVSVKTKSLGAVFPVYLQPLLFGSGLDEVEMIGRMELDLKLSQGSISDFHLLLDDVYADDQDSRFHIAGLNGDIRLNSDPNVKDSMMTWRGGSIYQVNIGASSMKLSSKGRSMRLRESMRIPIFDGQLQVNDLEMTDLGLENYSIRIESSLMPITLSEFTEALGWPIMAGYISGEIPGVKYHLGNLTTEGMLRVNVFDGEITIVNLWIENLFGLVPSLSADMNIDNIDLGILTKTFEFGDITGRLDGYMQDLRLENWEPVQFDAKLATPKGDRSKHRISQRAIDNITSIGGGGTDAISRGVLGVFKDFPYSKIGLSCRLSNSVCFMDGVEKTDNGYYIVKRGFLPPWLNIKGYNNRVDWPELLERLKNISEAESPTIE